MSEIGRFVDSTLLQAWLDDHAIGEAGDLRVEIISGGRSNITLRLERPGELFVLRRPSPGALDLAARNRVMAREYRLLKALARTNVPHADVLGFCDDPAIAGCSFFVMRHVEGFVGSSPLPAPFDCNEIARRELGVATVEALATLANVDWSGIGLTYFGKPDGFLQRQPDRWMGELAKYTSRDLPGIEKLSGWLKTHCPSVGPVGLMHGDFQSVNVLYAFQDPTTVAAIVDWEQSTIGDPLLDLGWLVAGWQQPGEPPRFSSYLVERDGLPTRQEMVSHYADRTGLQIDDIRFYVVLALFKLACLLEGGYFRYRSGLSDDPEHATWEHLVPALIAQALESTVSVDVLA